MTGMGDQRGTPTEWQHPLENPTCTEWEPQLRYGFAGLKQDFRLSPPFRIKFSD